MDAHSPQAPSRRPRPGWLTVLMLACLAVPAGLQAALELAASGRIEAAAGLWRVVTGETSRQDFESDLKDRSHLARWARRFYAPITDELLERGNSQVLFGDDGWLFFREAVDYVTGPPIPGTPAATPSGAPGDPGSVIVEFHRQLEAQGAGLLVIPVPVKATLYPERLWPGADPYSAPNNPGFAPLTAALREAGVQVLDLTPVLLEAKRQGADVFLARDTHWTPVATSIVADAVASRVSSLPAWRDLETETAPFDHRRVTFTGRGDLYDMLAYAPWERKLRPVDLELIQVVADRRRRGPRRRDSPILLLGDSLTNVFSSSELEMGRRAGFGEQLASRLEMSIDVVAMPAGGASRSRQTWALRPDPLRGKRLVIWQFTQRDLLFAADGWRATPPLIRRDDGRPDVAASERYSLVGWLSATTRLPEKLDYADCLIVSRYRRVDGETPGGTPTVDVVQWGVEDWQLTPAAGFRNNAIHRLEIGPLPPEIDLESTCWLDGVGLESQPWWVYEVEPR